MKMLPGSDLTLVEAQLAAQHHTMDAAAYAALTQRWSGSSPNIQNAFAQQQERTRIRSMVIDEYNRLFGIIPAEDKAMRAIFGGWWHEYRVKAGNVYNEDEAIQTLRVAEVRIGFAKCTEAARAREKLREARAAQRKHNWETYGKQHR